MVIQVWIIWRKTSGGMDKSLRSSKNGLRSPKPPLHWKSVFAAAWQGGNKELRKTVVIFSSSLLLWIFLNELEAASKHCHSRMAEQKHF